MSPFQADGDDRQKLLITRARRGMRNDLATGHRSNNYNYERFLARSLTRSQPKTYRNKGGGGGVIVGGRGSTDARSKSFELRPTKSFG